MKIPPLDLKRQYVSIKDEIDSAIQNVLNHGGFVLGPEVKELERKLAEYCETKNGIGVASGTDALLLSLMAIGIKPGDEVITSTFTFFATGGVISRLGAKPVFVDIDPTHSISIRRLLKRPSHQKPGRSFRFIYMVRSRRWMKYPPSPKNMISS